MRVSLPGLPALPGLFAAVLVLAAAVSACDSRPPDTGDYATDVARLRAEKDALFQRSSSPIPDAGKATYLPLKYFPIDPAYNVGASLEPTTDRAVFMMATSTGAPRPYRRAGTLEFTLQGKPLTLTAFVEASAPDVNRLFVPFADGNTGDTTYSGGRFLDLERTPTGIYQLDFNKAYTPYCFYNPAFECPYPPPENHLPIPINAGEKIK
jgi:uncharacterized protein